LTEIVVVLVRPAATEVTVTLDGVLVVPPGVPPPPQLIRPAAAMVSNAKISSGKRRLNTASRPAPAEKSNIERRKATPASHDRGRGRQSRGHLLGVSRELVVPEAVLIVSTMPPPEELPAGIIAGLTVQDPPVNETATAQARFMSVGVRASDGAVSSFKSTVAALPRETCTVPGVARVILKSTFINGTLPAVARPSVDAVTE
jgi:hypothetical protein